LPEFGAENVFEKGDYCTFFRPMPADYGICYTMNSFMKVITLVNTSAESAIPLSICHIYGILPISLIF
jgi:hypothetical protein